MRPDSGSPSRVLEIISLIWLKVTGTPFEGSSAAWERAREACQKCDSGFHGLAVVFILMYR